MAIIVSIKISGPSSVLEFTELSRFLFSFFSIEDLTDLSVLRILKRLTFSHRYIPEKNRNGFGKFMNSAIELQIKHFSGLLELIEKSSLFLF